MYYFHFMNVFSVMISGVFLIHRAQLESKSVKQMREKELKWKNHMNHTGFVMTFKQPFRTFFSFFFFLQ